MAILDDYDFHELWWTEPPIDEQLTLLQEALASHLILLDDPVAAEAYHWWSEETYFAGWMSLDRHPGTDVIMEMVDGGHIADAQQAWDEYRKLTAHPAPPSSPGHCPTPEALVPQSHSSSPADPPQHTPDA